MSEYAYLRPVEGQTHDPDTWDKRRNASPPPGALGPWNYEYGGEVKSIYNRDGSPRPIPIEEARVAFAFFTPRVVSGDQQPKVEMEVFQGDLELRVPTSVQTATCHLCGKSVPVSDLSRHVVECLSTSDDEAGAPGKSLDQMDRAELFVEADRRKLDYPRNISREKLLELILDAEE